MDSGRGTDLSNPVIAVDHDACILCDRCVRACDDIQGNDVIGRSGKGYATRIAFDLNDPMGASSCVTCGECVAACPTGALTNKPIHDIPIRPRTELDAVDSVCPYCGVGCALTYYVDRERGAIAFAEGRDQPGSQGRLCVKGRYGWDYAASPQRLTDAADPARRRPTPRAPLSGGRRGGEDDGRRASGRKGRAARAAWCRYDEVLPHFREATWDEALDLVARRLREIHAERGPAAIAGFGSAKCSNEEAYLFQKLHPHRLPHQQRRPLHPAVPRLQRGRPVRGHRLRRGVHDVRRRGERRRRDRHRQQRPRQPPGRVVLLQAGPAPRHDDHLRRPAGRQAWPTTPTSTASSSPAPTSRSTTRSCTR